MSESNRLTKEQQDYFYRFIEAFHMISTDLRNADNLMHGGKFFDAMDRIRECQQTAMILEQKVVDCVNALREDNKW
jgi:hypothetical protein